MPLIQLKKMSFVVVWFNYSMALLYSERASVTTQMIVDTSTPEANIIILPKWSWLDGSNWFSIITVFPVLSSVAAISQRYIPTNFSVSISVNEIPNSSPKIAIFSSFESHYEKSYCSCSYKSQTRINSSIPISICSSS